MSQVTRIALWRWSLKVFVFVIVFVFVFVNFLVMSCLFKCLKGNKSLGSLCSAVKTLIVSGVRQRDRPRDKVTYWAVGWTAKKDNDKGNDDKDSDEETWPDQKRRRQWQRHMQIQRQWQRQIHLKSTFKERSQWLVTFETLITFLTIENLNSWQSLLPDN